MTYLIKNVYPGKFNLATEDNKHLLQIDESRAEPLFDLVFLIHKNDIPFTIDHSNKTDRTFVFLSDIGVKLIYDHQECSFYDVEKKTYSTEFPNNVASYIDCYNGGLILENVYMKTIQENVKFFSLDKTKHPELYSFYKKIKYLNLKTSISIEDGNILFAVTIPLADPFELPYYISYKDNKLKYRYGFYKALSDYEQKLKKDQSMPTPYFIHKVINNEQVTISSKDRSWYMDFCKTYHTPIFNLLSLIHDSNVPHTIHLSVGSNRLMVTLPEINKALIYSVNHHAFAFNDKYNNYFTDIPKEVNDYLKSREKTQTEVSNHPELDNLIKLAKECNVTLSANKAVVPHTLNLSIITIQSYSENSSAISIIRFSYSIKDKTFDCKTKGCTYHGNRIPSQVSDAIRNHDKYKKLKEEKQQTIDRNTDLNNQTNHYLKLIKEMQNHDQQS